MRKTYLILNVLDSWNNFEKLFFFKQLLQKEVFRNDLSVIFYQNNYKVIRSR